MWQTAAQLGILKKRAQLLGDCRSFFVPREVMEVEVPVLGKTGVTDPNIECFQAEGFTLQSSPEYYMKRMLASGSGDIYYLGKAFRKEEAGCKHRPEFTILEWYRQGWDENQLIAEVVDLLCFVAAANTNAIVCTYADCFSAATGLNPHVATAQELAGFASTKLDINFDLHSKSEWLDLLFSHLVEPTFEEQLYVVKDYPICQAALARVTKDFQVARRFEVFWKGLELANGYWELCDAEEQKRRFEADLSSRRAQGKAEPAMDENLIAALEQGMPACAGVALGVDRLLMCLSGERDIGAVQAFASMS